MAPAGNMEKVQIALAYGADAVYVGADGFSLREYANLSRGELKKAIKYVHERGKKIYVAVNLFAHNKHLNALPDSLSFLREEKVDAVIISDAGVFDSIKNIAPEMPVHISTQANITNWASAMFWQQQGARRLILARELSWAEIQEIREKTTVELEIFVHGAMCLSYSGRCWLSLAMAGRDGNAGDCAQPCRWNYAIVEETRPGIYFPVETGDRYTAVMSSRDLCLVEEIPEIVKIGLDSIKIEGRMKSSYYEAVTTRVYQRILSA